ncbi:zona pellucida sperm-binding protein 4-like [Centroberyx affinis]|uniref:zona pellucida sperm-binding protein 4-like n=1 Tax=Centroberyx affinis TaxID=166261 RepID=UPI003A5B96A8
MAGHRVGLLLLLLTGTLLVSVRGWERVSSGPWWNVNQTQMDRFYQTGQWDDGSDYSDGEGVVTEVEDTTTDSDPLADHGFHVEYVDAAQKKWTDVTKSSGLEVLCSESEFQITLLSGPLSEVKVLGSKALLSVLDAPESCGYDVNLLSNTVTVPFLGCHVKRQTDHYTLQLLYVNELGQADIATASCEASVKLDSDLQLPRSSGPQVRTSKCANPPKAQNCDVPKAEQVTCGQTGISSSDCEKMGCCVDSSTSACYYPVDECTADKQFVFAIRHDSAFIPVDPTKLVVPGHPSCKPVIVNDKLALFKFSVTDCGARSYDVGETKIYMVEVQSVVEALNLKYGVITRNNPLRFMIECRYAKNDNQQSLASVGYMVKSPSSSVPSKVVSNGRFGVELRIAEDQTYSTYLPTYHQPLKLLLGKPVYLEVRLKSPRPDAAILVNYCLAYPRSAKNALVLIYEGCANPHDPNVSILKVSDLPKNRHQRRFVVKAFQFMDQQTNKYLDEEIYFMCSAEVCRVEEKTCRERCFDGKAP